MKFFLEYSKELDIADLLDTYHIAGIFVPESETVESDLANDIFKIEDNGIYHNAKRIGTKILIDSPESMEKALNTDFDADLDILLVETGDWHIIPIENLIAKFANMDTQLIASASTPEEIHLVSNILELGVDGCLLQVGDYSIAELLEIGQDDQKPLQLQELAVSSVERIGNGDRVCVDTVSILHEGEGMLVGSTSAVQALVQAEVEESGFVSSRPFRVNAGVVASYTLNFDKTNYLSELATGSTVMIVDREGNNKKEYVARVKIERRPLIVVKCNYEGKSYPIVLQDAETVKLVTSTGSKRVDRLETGEKILCHISKKARHFGMEIDESIEER